MEKIPRNDYDAFRAFLKDACGIVLGENKHYLINSRLKTLMRECGVDSLAALLIQLKNPQQHALRMRIVDAMTTNETYWFRDNHPYMMLGELVIPELLKTGRSRIRIWSAACSSGQEPYSISMICEEFMVAKRRPTLNMEILATDISPTMLATAKEALYDELALSRGLSQERRSKFFKQEGSQWRVIDRVKQRVRFSEINLTKSFAALGKFDIIFCRNVLIYFSPELKQDIIKRFSQVLAPDGFLILGGSESIVTGADDFDIIRIHGGLLFRGKSA